MANIHRLRGETEEVLQYVQQAVELGRQSGGKSREAIVWVNADLSLAISTWIIKIMLVQCAKTLDTAL